MRTTLPTAITPGAFRNPVTGRLVTPGEVLGYRADGRPIYVIAGGDGTGDDGTGSDSTDDDSDDQDETDAPGDATKKPEIKGEFDKERAARSLAAAREAEKKAKTDAKTAKERLDAVLKAAGLTADGKTDPAEQLKAASAERDAATAKARSTAVELAVYKSAARSGADPDAILDSRGFMAAVAELDPDTADFGDKVSAAIKAAVKTNPKLATTVQGQGPGNRRGGDHTGGNNGKQRPAGLGAAVAARITRT